ncbi:ABC transporter transmembrane domain-containing protein [Alishewanella sp. SMS8]|uniref:ABC transporter transmembrane domain-containing protein n=1 Tax=Alishewanella sp. SMS8 TaxID=2994676 RepID=UPI0027416293|nr:ABC transporter transmembrane domain-containing protein [Alishewanella sp. SMS8]MDP4945989.1 ABC transporter transmembrane domain-containing protein [Alishewanella sp.]MDP5187915.1 ABC transporter transmembrane domain-containing protein [Alishewanella sp.]MDP5460414.1 ABC transporter transmembrane domain-containing protein [Alishewanella sp. SMS8]
MTVASKGVATRAVLPWIGRFLLPYRGRVVAAIVFLLIGSLAWLGLGQGVRLMVDEGFVTGNLARLNQLTALVLGITLLASVAVFLRFYFMSWLGERVSADIRNAVYHNMLRLSPAFYSETRTGEVISRFTADTTLLQSVVGSSLSMALRSAVTAIGGLIMMAFTSFKLTALVFIAVPLVLLPILVLGKKVRQLARDSQDKLAVIGAHVDQSLHEIHTVQAYGHEARDETVFKAKIEQVLAAARGRIFYRALLIGTVMLLSIGAITIVGYVGALDVVSGKVSPGQLTAFLFYAVMVAGGMATISEVIGEVQRAAGAAERLIELAEMPVTISAPVQPLTLTAPVRGELQFKQVAFAYPQVPEQTVLSQLDLHIQPGERLALVGPSGAGKSTLFQLLQRFYDVTAGSIALDGQAITQLDPQQLRAQFALVPQDAVIFADSVVENVRYGRPEASLADVKAACQAARADEFIQQFSAGYETQLGERGVRLSGGQKQRIAIARAILADRPILLLDEATSALDASSEHAVKQALEQAMQGRTTLIIAHRLSTVLTADRILVLDQGRVIASGKHDELLQSCALYQELAQLQFLTE